MLTLLASLAGGVVVIAGDGAAVRASLPGGVLIVSVTATLSAAIAQRPLHTYAALCVTTWMSLFDNLTLLPIGLPALVAASWIGYS